MAHSPLPARSAADLTMLTAAMAVLAKRGTQKMSSQQMLYFLSAATADVMGAPTNVAGVMGSYSHVGRSLEKTAVNFLEPTDRYPDALGWLEQTHDPNDKRTRNLILTEAGVAVVAELIDAMRYA